MQDLDNNKAREKAMMEKIPFYSPPVLIGLWNDNLFYEEAKNQLLLEKMQRNELLVQKTRAAMTNLCHDIKLTSEHKYVMYGHTIQIKCPGVTSQPVSNTILGDKNTNLGLYLCGTVSATEISSLPPIVNIPAYASAAAANQHQPCVRNTFTIWHQSNCPQSSSKIVQYNEPIYICNASATNNSERVYLTTKIPLLDDPPAANNQLPVYFHNRPDRYSRWMIQYWDPSYRFEMEQSPVQANSQIIITNLATGRNLAVETNCWFLTFFGTECSVTCHTCKNFRKMETAENIWEIVTQLPDDKSLVYCQMQTGREQIQDGSQCN